MQIYLYRYINIGNRTEGVGHTDFRSEGYNIKTFYKTEVVLEALQAGVSVFFVDSDCFFLKNPLSYLKKFSDFDLATTQELNGTIHNSGLYLAHPTPATIKLHKKIITMQDKKPNRSNQQILNDIMVELENNNLNITALGKNKFYDGREYFYQHHLYHCCSFPYNERCPRSEAIIQHSNIAFTLGVKIYRFKEQLMWEVDKNGLVFTDCIRSMAEGTVYTGVSHSFSAKRGGCLVGGMCVSGQGWVPGQGVGCLVKGGCLVSGGVWSEGGCLVSQGVWSGWGCLTERITDRHDWSITFSQLRCQQ